MRTMQDLYQMQGLPLELKIRMTKSRIRDWINAYGEDGVYVSFSGGKDSTVLLDLVRQDYPRVKAVFVDTGLEYPEIRQFVKTFDNVEWLKPKMTFKQVIKKYGYPFISKEVSECVQGARKYLTQIIAESSLDRPTDRPTDTVQVLVRESYWNGRIPKASNREDIINTSTKRTEYLERTDKASIARNSGGGGTITNGAKREVLANILNDRMIHRKGGQNQRLAIMLGMLTSDKDHPIKENNPNKDRSMFSQEKYSFFLDAPFEISNKCCNVMKKEPAHRYQKQTGRNPMTAQMATESRLRTQKWLQNGCNGFDLKSPISNPMAFWTEQDVLLYIKTNNLPICSVYGDIVKDNSDGVEGQMDLEDVYGKELFDLGRPLLKTTGCNRTGCMFCGFGCHLEKPGEGRFERMKKTHPKQYEYIMKPEEEGGLNYKEVIDWINEHGNLNIRY